MIQKSELQQVPVEQRVPGRLYGVADDLDGELNSFRILKYGNESTSGQLWCYWFEIPESLLPVREVQLMPEVGKEYEFSENEVYWGKHEFMGFKANHTTYKYIRPIQTFRSLTIPSGSKSEQIAELEKILAELKKS